MCSESTVFYDYPAQEERIKPVLSCSASGLVCTEGTDIQAVTD